MTSDEVVGLVARFEDGTLPKAEWTHQAHLAVALWHASRLPFEEALVVWCGRGSGRSSRRTASPPRRPAVLARYGARDLPLRHYTKDLLMSSEARFGWVEPDLRPLA